MKNFRLEIKLLILILKFLMTVNFCCNEKIYQINFSQLFENILMKIFHLFKHSVSLNWQTKTKENSISQFHLS